MRIHKEGYKILRNQFIIFLLLNYITYWNSEIIFNVLVLPTTIIIFLLSIYFFRDPNRENQLLDDYIYSPCDGKIVSMTEEKTEYFNDKRIRISIFMSPLNIHSQLYPMDGKIKYSKYHPGKYFVAWHPKSSLLNERHSIAIENNMTSILVTQIAGFVARRIVNYSNVGDTAVKGEKYGFIKFGSRIDIYLPLDSKILVKLNQKLKGGETIIANY